MAELKTTPEDTSVRDFINSVDNGGKRRVAGKNLEMMGAATGAEPKMWTAR